MFVSEVLSVIQTAGEQIERRKKVLFLLAFLTEAQSYGKVMGWDGLVVIVFARIMGCFTQSGGKDADLHSS